MDLGCQHLCCTNFTDTSCLNLYFNDSARTSSSRAVVKDRTSLGPTISAYTPEPAHLPTLQDALDVISDTPKDTITVFITGTDDDSPLESYADYLLPSHALTWHHAFGPTWLSALTTTLPPSLSWLPSSQSHYALASCASGTVHVLMPFRRNPSNPHQDARASPWTTYIYPTLTRNPSVTSISLIDIHAFSRYRTIWRRGDAPRGTPAYVGETFLTPDAPRTYLLDVMRRGHAIPSAKHPTVFWSSLCPDSENCLDKSEALVGDFMARHLRGPAVHWFNLASYWGTAPNRDTSSPSSPSSATDLSTLVRDHLRIARDSPCFHEPGITAVLQASTAVGVAYVILRGEAEVERPHVGVKERCWWCECEMPVLTRNGKVSAVVRVDEGDLGRWRVVWRRGEGVVGKSPFE